MLILGIMGRAGAGKSVVAEELIWRAGFRRAKFARPLKIMLSTLLAYRGASEIMVERMIEGDLKEIPTPLLNGKSPRHAMLTLGTEWGRDLIDTDLWVDSEMDRVRNDVWPRVIFDDVRFENEARAIRSLGGLIVRVDRPGRKIDVDHASERLDVVPDKIISNTRDLTFLREQIKALIAALIPAPPVDDTPHEDED